MALIPRHSRIKRCVFEWERTQMQWMSVYPELFSLFSPASPRVSPLV